MSSKKLTDYLIVECNDTNSEVDRFIKDLLIKIEFGHFEPDDEVEFDQTEYV
ncbi:hypothetical protein [Paenibacillus anaericanus]|uniref:hypothetical protein n=1 Tax=Paenibacillus anaericanus TaxID=170367 RepID=UPI001477379B|nr:hypothetical protein [Paenibacillus anaericanus]